MKIKLKVYNANAIEIIQMTDEMGDSMDMSAESIQLSRFLFNCLPGGQMNILLKEIADRLEIDRGMVNDIFWDVLGERAEA